MALIYLNASIIHFLRLLDSLCPHVGIFNDGGSGTANRDSNHSADAIGAKCLRLAPFDFVPVQLLPDPCALPASPTEGHPVGTAGIEGLVMVSGFLFPVLILVHQKKRPAQTFNISTTNHNPDYSSRSHHQKKKQKTNPRSVHIPE